MSFLPITLTPWSDWPQIGSNVAQYFGPLYQSIPITKRVKEYKNKNDKNNKKGTRPVYFTTT